MVPKPRTVLAADAVAAVMIPIIGVDSAVGTSDVKPPAARPMTTFCAVVASVMVRSAARVPPPVSNPVALIDRLVKATATVLTVGAFVKLAPANVGVAPV